MPMADSLPPLAAIRVFEAAARHLSFTRAAVELGMTQAAVSYQIKLLEERVGGPLFLRRPRALSLTEIGQQLAPERTRRAQPGKRVLEDPGKARQARDFKVCGRHFQSPVRLLYCRHLRPKALDFQPSVNRLA